MRHILIVILLALVNFASGQKIIKVNFGDTLYFSGPYDEVKQAKGLTIAGPRLKDSLPDGIYKVYECRSYGKLKYDTVLYLEATYVNGVKHGQEIFYGHYYGRKPYLNSIMLTEYKNGLVDGMFIDAFVNAENNVSITELKQYKNDMQNGISIRAPFGIILEVLLYKNDEVTDTLWKANDSINVWDMALKQPYFGGEYLQRLLKEERKLKRKK